MSSAKKYEMAPEELYIQNALREGRCRLDELLSMKALGPPDKRYQGRVQYLDMDHVHRLDLVYRQDGKLAPIVVFRAIDGPVVRYIMADGFHRHEVYKRAGSSTIRAYVIDVPMERIEHEARIFAAMCNQVTSLGRTPQDMRKAVEMLFEVPECWEWPAEKIAAHCGVNAKTVEKYRKEYAIRNRRDLPRRPRPKPIPTGMRPESRPATLPLLPAGAEDEPRSDAPPPLASPRSFRDWLLDRGVLAESQRRHGGNLLLGSGFVAGRRAIILCPATDPDGLYSASGKAIAFAKHIMPDGMPTVVLEKVRSHALIYSVLEQCGVAFLTPEELVAETRAAHDDPTAGGSDDDGE